MKHSRKILAATAIAPLVFLMGCSDPDTGMEEFEEQQMQEERMQEQQMQEQRMEEEQMQEQPPRDDGMQQQPPRDDGMSEQGGSMEPEGDDNL
ncbi:hypothetical protein [Thioalkalivibrio sp. ALMg11]|uniref:hypothetical protein n=1 Tax=Thioalkalivibrio sp. ALMg11 TaxID=1158165 RepID=UPI0003734B85|nr:hypothetical protein [Thioalkalivibrio sp. ALMg11]